MMRNVIAVVVGLAAGMAVNMAIVMLNSKVLFPIPEGLDWTDEAGVAVYIGTLPWTAFVVVLTAHLGQSFVGGLVAAHMSKDKPMMVALIVGAATLAGGLVNLNSIPHPSWMWIEVPLYMVTAWAAGNLVMVARPQSQIQDFDHAAEWIGMPGWVKWIIFVAGIKFLHALSRGGFN